jgi:transcriptional regulator of acetoin/glycerol metabolism
MEEPRRVPPPWNHPNGLIDLTLDSAIRRHIVRVLEYTDGQKDWAAEEMGISPSTLYRELKRWDQGRPKNVHRREGLELMAQGGS